MLLCPRADAAVCVLRSRELLAVDVKSVHHPFLYHPRNDAKGSVPLLEYKWDALVLGVNTQACVGMLCGSFVLARTVQAH
jgi:hypothetical protein